jgi:tRNA (guanine37-N1)-methyltransferase
MIFDIITIFPEMFSGVLEYGILHRARKAGLVDFRIVNLRDFTRDRHKSVDDRPYGGGEGMILLPAPLFEAVEFCRNKEKKSDSQVVLLTPQGKTWSQKYATEFSTISHLILICGRYEGLDQRVIDCLVDREISVGDFILTGGEIPAMVVLDSVVRLLPGALGRWESAVNESFSTGLLDYPQYTRPADYRGHKVPEVLLSGNHENIEKWRKQKALEKTEKVRPELLVKK